MINNNLNDETIMKFLGVNEEIFEKLKNKLNN